MDVVVENEIVVGDLVLLSCGDSSQLMKVSDLGGCQIRLDGEVKSVQGGWCQVLVLFEAKRGSLGIQPVSVMLHTRLKAVELTDRVHVWSRLDAKTIDRVRNTGTDECDYWVPLTSDE